MSIDIWHMVVDGVQLVMVVIIALLLERLIVAIARLIEVLARKL